MTRRFFLLGGAVALLGGCSSSGQRLTTSVLPATRDWSPASDPELQAGPSGGASAQSATNPRPSHTSDHTRSAPSPASSADPAPAHTDGKVIQRAFPRGRWADAAASPDRMNPLGAVDRLTVHHEGSSPVWFTSVAQTADRLENIRRVHRQRMHAGDIGYHFVIDRAGRLWCGRSLAYQGAHVKNHNVHNLGIMVLGNFEQQKPTPAQLHTLQATLRACMIQFGVEVGRVYTHRELGPTACPGRNLQPQMDHLRRSGALAV